MRNEHLNQLLNELPRQEASESFTEVVMARVARESGVNPISSWRHSLITAATVLALVSGATWFAMEQREQGRIEAFEVQRQALEKEIAALREQTEFDPIIDLGQEDGVHYILDLRPVEVQPVQTVALQPTFD